MTSDAVDPHQNDKTGELAGRQLPPEQAAAAAMAAEARQRGLEPAGPDGLLELFTKNVLETALDEEVTGHLGMRRTGLSPAASLRMCATAPGPRRSSPMR
jgi:putative transposase